MFLNKSMLISDIIKRENNNLNFIRLWLAFAVIVGHVKVFISSPGPTPIFSYLFPFTYCGNIAVVAFFFFSGLFVANSLFERQNVVNYIVSRILRIYPALLFVLVISSIISFYFSNLEFKEYFTEALKYIKHNFFVGYNEHILSQISTVSFMREGYPLDGQYSTSINGALWILPFEVRLYTVLLGLFWISNIIKKYGKFVIIILVVIGIFSPVIFEKQLLGGDNSETLYLIPSFSFGVLLALFKDKIYLDYKFPLSLFIIGSFLHNDTISHLLLFFALNLSCLYISSLTIIRKLPLKIDISYGVYIWGWFVQQIVQYYTYPFVNFYTYAAICIIVSGIMGLITYELIEKPCLKIKNWFMMKGCKNASYNGM